MDQQIAAINPAKAMALTAIDLLYDGAREAHRIKAESRPLLTRDEYLKLVRGFAREKNDTSEYLSAVANGEPSGSSSASSNR